MEKTIIICWWLFWLAACSIEKNKLSIQDIEIFRNTPVWDLVLAIDKEDDTKIRRILEADSSLWDYQEPLYGTTVLMRAIGSEKFKASKQILESGANPNIISKNGYTALFQAISFSWKDVTVNEDPKFVKLLLDNHADPNINYCSPKIAGQTDPIECGTSPLIHSISRGIEKTKLLVKSGAHIDYKTNLSTTAAIQALLLKDINAAYFLIVDKKASIKEPYYYYDINDDKIIDTTQPHYPVDLLLDWVFPIGSDEHKRKMMIVKEFKDQGIDYYESKKNIRDLTLSRIKKIHMQDWENYLNEY